MKKFLAFILAVAFMMTSMNLVWAEEVDGEKEETEKGKKIEISFKVGDEILKINNEDVKVEKPVVINGVTLVPLRVISEAFGAQVNWDEKSRLVTLDYSGVNIKLYIDNRTAIVDGNETELLEAPKVINGRTMVPMRFITENFGANVDYQSDTKLITVVKEIVSENSIKDFSLVLKKTTKTKVGDSYHKWSMDFPKTLKLDYRNFTGTLNIFKAVDESYSMLMTIIDKGDYTIDSLMSKVLSDVKDYTLLYQGKEKEGDKEYIKVVWRDKTACAEYRAFFSDEKLYEINTFFKDYSQYKGNEEIKKQLASFNLNFPLDSSAEDLSDVDGDGFRPYENKNLKLSFKIMADWTETTNDAKENEIFFRDKDFESMYYCTMFSYDKGLTLDQVVEKEKQNLADEYNTNLFKIVKVEDSKINGVDCKVIYYTLQLNTKTYYITDVYVLGKNYVYNIGCNMDTKTYNDSKLKFKVESAIFSFKFEEPDADELGLMIDQNKIKASDEMRNIKVDKYNFSVDLPVSWIEAKEKDEDEILNYSDSDHDINVSVYAFDNIPSASALTTQMEKNYRASAQEDSNFTLDSVSTVTEKGIKIKKFETTFRDKTSTYSQEVYVLQKGDRVYTVYFLINNIKKSTKNIQMLDKIWDSMKFE